MVLDVKKTRPNNGILVNKEWNCSGMMADNTSGRTFHQCNILQLKNEIKYIGNFVRIK